MATVLKAPSSQKPAGTWMLVHDFGQHRSFLRRLMIILDHFSFFDYFRSFLLFLIFALRSPSFYFKNFLIQVYSLLFFKSPNWISIKCSTNSHTLIFFFLSMDLVCEISKTRSHFARRFLWWLRLMKAAEISIHAFIQQTFMSICYVPHTVLGIWDLSVIKISDQNTCCHRAYLLYCEETDNKQQI